MRKNGNVPPDETATPERKPTPAFIWRQARSEGYVITLPSGRVATLRSVSLDQLISSGRIPDILSPVAARSLWEETPVGEIANQDDLSRKYLELINFVVPLAMVIPKIVEEPREGEEEIALSDVDFVDKLGIFNLVTQSAELLRNFRDDQVRDMELAFSSEDIRTEAELPSG